MRNYRKKRLGRLGSKNAKIARTSPCDAGLSRVNFLREVWCGRVDSNHHGIATASPSSWCVCQFRHDRVSELNKYRREEPLMRAATVLESRQVAPVSRVPAANLNCLGTGASLQWPTGVPAQAPPDRKPLQVGNCPVLSF